MDTSDIAFFVVQNSDGAFFRRKGYGGSGETWVKTLSTARVWTKIGGARSTVTFFANHYPNYPVPKIIKMTVAATEIIDENDRIEKAKAKRAKQERESELRESKRRMEEAQRDLQKAQERYDREQRKLSGRN